VLNQRNKTEEEKTAAFCEEFLAFFDKIPTNWRVNYEKAKEYNDVTQYVIEENKLSVAEQLKNYFSSIIK